MLCAQLIGLIGLGTSTFAWLISSSKANISVQSANREFSVIQDTYSFSITDGTQAWTSGGSITVTEGTDKKLAPAAHEDLSSSVHASNPGTWYYEYAESASSHIGQGDKTYLTSSDFGQYVYAQDFYFKASSTIAGIMVDSVTLPDSAQNMGVSVLFEGPDGNVEFKKTTPIGFTRHINLLANVGDVTPTETKPYGDQKITAYIYIDGNNEYVKTINAQNIQGEISFGFSIYSPEKEIYLQSKESSFGANNALMYVYAWKQEQGTLYENSPFPGVQMTHIAKSRYYESSVSDYVTIYSQPLDKDGYTHAVFTAVNPNHGNPINRLDSNDIWYQTTDVDISGGFDGKMVTLENTATGGVDERGRNKFNYVSPVGDFTGVQITYLENVGDANPYYTTAIAPGIIPASKIPPVPSKRRCTFLGWALSTSPTEVLSLDTHTFSADTTLVAVFSDPTPGETFTIYFQAKNNDPDWLENDTYGASLYMWEEGTDNKNAAWPGVPMTLQSGIAGDTRGYKYYSGQISTDYTHFVIAKVLKGTTDEVDGHKWQTQDCVIQRGTQENRFMWITNEHDDDGGKSIYDIGGWIGYPEHVVSFYRYEDDASPISTVYVGNNATISQSSIPTPTTPKRYIFDYWTINDVEVDLTNYRFTSDAKVVAHFTEEIPLEQYTVHFEADNSWKEQSGEFGAAIHMWDYNNPTVATQTIQMTDQGYDGVLNVQNFTATMTNDYNKYEIIKVRKSDGQVVSGHEMKTVVIDYNKSAQENKFIRLGSDTGNGRSVTWVDFPLFTVTFKALSTDTFNIAQLRVPTGNTIPSGTAPANPTLRRYTFNNWTTDGGGVFDVYNTPITSNITVYGSWTESVALDSYQIYFEAKQDWKEDTNCSAAIYMWDSNNPTTRINAPWPGVEMTYVTFDSAKNVNYYTANVSNDYDRYQIVKVVRGGGSSPVQPSSDKMRTDTISYNKSAQEGKYVWYNTVKEVVDDTTVYNIGGWIGYPERIITFQVDGVTYATKHAPNNEVISDGLPADPTKFGYTFASWQINGVDVSKSTLQTQTWSANATVTARFSKQSTYKVYFEAKPNWKGDGSYVAYAHMWDQYGNYNTAYPGVAMTHERYSSTVNCDYYSIDVPTGATGLVFARVHKTNGDTGQKTNDITLNRSTMEGKYAWTSDSATNNIFSVDGWANYIAGAQVTVKVDGVTTQTIDTKGDGTIPAPTTPTKSNYTFDYWKYSGGSKINDITTEVFTTNTTIEAVWKYNSWTLYLETWDWYNNDNANFYISLTNNWNNKTMFTWQKDEGGGKYWYVTIDQDVSSGTIYRTSSDGSTKYNEVSINFSVRNGKINYYLSSGGTGWK